MIRKGALRQKVRTATAPAPVGGWNARDSVASMKPTDAVVLKNFFPSTSEVTMRKGHSQFATGMTSAVETLFVYDGGATPEMFAAADNKIYDVTLGSAATAVSSGYTNNRWQYVKFGTPGGQFIVAVNGEDSSIKYDGSAWSANTITGTGLTATDLVDVCAYNRRLFFAEAGTLRFWYLAVTTISGAASQFDLSSLFNLGGYLQKIETWTIDGGEGLQNLICFITSKGQVAVYYGTDPSDAANWALKGIYRLPEPIGRRCTMQYGGDVLVITEGGIYPLSRALITGGVDPKQAISDKISSAFNDSSRLYGANFGWQAILYPKGTYGLFNIPTQENGASLQYVFNTITGAWCEFEGQDASCWALFNQNLYFGGTGKVYKADDGESDNGDAIEADCLPAFNAFGSPGLKKQFTLARPVWFSRGDVSPAININVNFDSITRPTSIPVSSGGGGTPWYSPWYSSWGSAAAIRTNQISVTGLGYTAAARIIVSSATQQISLLSIDYTYQTGNIL